MRGRRVAGLLLLTHLAGCVGWRTERIAPEQVIVQKYPGKVRVTHPDQTRLVIYQPRLLGDSIVGITFVPVEVVPSVQPGNPSSSIEETAAGIALADIRRIETRGFSAGKTVLLAGGIALGALVALAIAVGEALGAEPKVGDGF